MLKLLLLRFWPVLLPLGAYFVWLVQARWRTQQQAERRADALLADIENRDTAANENGSDASQENAETDAPASPPLPRWGDGPFVTMWTATLILAIIGFVILGFSVEPDTPNPLP